MIPGVWELEFKHDGSIQMATEASVMILKHPLKKKKKLPLSWVWGHSGNVVPSHSWTILLLTMAY